MTNLLLKGAICAALLGVSVACTDGYSPYKPTSPNKGTMSLKVEIDKSLANGKASRAEYSDITADDLSLSLTSSEGDFQETWDNLSDFPEEKEIPVGEYTVEVAYGDPDSEGFESPYFYGSQTISIAENESTEVNISATLQNAMLSIDYTQDFKDYMTSWKAETRSAGGTTTVIEADEDRPVYIKEGRVDVSVEFTKPNGKGGKLEVASFEAVGRRNYHLTVDIAGNGSGVAAITVKLDESLDEETLVLDISDEILSAAGPEITTSDFEPTDILPFIPGFADGLNAKVNIMARGGLKSIMMHTTGTALLDMEWPADVDLLTASAEVRSKLEELGLGTRGIFNNPDRLAVLDFAPVLNNIIYMSNGDNITSFELVVKDRYGKVSEPFTATFEAQRAELELVSGTAYVGGEAVTVDFKFNAGHTAGLKFEYYNPALGVWNETPAVIRTLSNSTTADYRAEMNIYGEQTLKVRASAAKITSNELDIERTPQVILKGEPNAFAKRVYIPITIGEKDDDAALVAALMKEAKVYLSTDGKTFTQRTTNVVNGYRMLSVAELTPNRTYYAKIRNGATDLNSVSSFSFTTEEDAHIENRNDWVSHPVNSGSNWEEYEFPGWGTNNPLTTSQGSDYGYCRASGTIPTTEAVTEGSAILLRTIGWGSGNSATGSKGTSGACKYTDPGLFHLGASRTTRPVGYSDNDHVSNKCSTGPVTTDDLDCGVEFPSRPANLKFHYKYKPKNSADKGYAEVWIKDAEGNIIARGTLNLDASSDWQLKTIPLTYTPDAAKGAKLYIKFLSSYDLEYVKRTDANFSGPGFANLGRGMFLGSQLWIDEIELGY
ncbi:MAG: DUF4493 domain-containing protein [Muribaculaceae bacterium]|nr:DUF4493 domain-containing protein [Muribaculaceae bacterium]